MAPITLVAGEGWRGHDPHPHVVYQAEHLSLAVVGIVRDAILAERAGCGATALVQRGDESALAGHLRRHLFSACHGALLTCHTRKCGTPRRACAVPHTILHP